MASTRHEADAVPHVAICIATYRRPQGLRALIDSLDAMRFEGVAPRVTLVVVDNDPDSGGAAVESARWPLIRLQEQQRGIVAARNRALGAVPADADLVGFLDDDETVTPGWLQAMMRTLDETGATAALGPLAPRFTEPPPAWAEALGMFRIGPLREGARLTFGNTGNCMMRGDFLRVQRLRFDPAFNLTGGEDEEFFRRLRDRGGWIAAAADALVHETVPAARLRPAWVIRRAYRKGNTLGRIAIRRRSGRVLRAAKGVAAILRGGLIALTAGLFSEVQRVRGLSEAARGFGMLAAFLNIRFSEYASPWVALDRGPGH